jgi:GIY-YIG catalytic domain
MATIYAIAFRSTGQAYVGCTRSKIGKRMREHRCLLRAGKHTSRLFQQVHDQIGPADMLMVALETVADDSVIARRERELAWLQLYAEKGLLLNDSMKSFAPPAGAQALAAQARVRNGYRPSAESNLKRRLAQLGRPKKRKTG